MLAHFEMLSALSWIFFRVVTLQTHSAKFPMSSERVNLMFVSVCVYVWACIVLPNTKKGHEWVRRYSVSKGPDFLTLPIKKAHRIALCAPQCCRLSVSEWAACVCYVECVRWCGRRLVCVWQRLYFSAQQCCLDSNSRPEAAMTGPAVSHPSVKVLDHTLFLCVTQTVSGLEIFVWTPVRPQMDSDIISQTKELKDYVQVSLNQGCRTPVLRVVVQYVWMISLLRNTWFSEYVWGGEPSDSAGQQPSRTGIWHPLSIAYIPPDTNCSTSIPA